jgi:uncharacterized protein
MTIDPISLSRKEQKLEETLLAYGSVIVAYSGGVDSSLLALYARKVLGDAAKVVIALSPSLAQEELSSARDQAKQFRWNLIEIETNELQNPDYERNDQMRCYFCKKTLFTELEEIAAKENIARIAYGANIDDKSDYRPGHKAASEFHVVSPLQDADLTKEEIRELAKNAALPSWNRPQAACLASRFPTFEPVTLEGLSKVDRSEAYLHSLGFQQVRVRHYGDTAKVEIDKSELDRLLNDAALSEQVIEKLKEHGYREVTIEREGYRRGSANTFLQVNTTP